MDPPGMFPYKQPQMHRVFAAFETMLRDRAGRQPMDALLSARSG
jgi:hypothetical protein